MSEPASLDAAPRRRRPSPRRTQVHLTMGRGAARGLIVAGVIGALGLFAAGYWLGLRGSSPSPPAIAVSPAPVEASAPAPPSAPPAPAPAAPAPAAPPPPPPVPEIEVQREPPEDGYGLQLAAYDNEPEALEFVASHAEALADHEVYVLAVRIPDKGVWHRVRVGRFSTRRAASAGKGALGPELGEGALVVSYR